MGFAHTNTASETGTVPKSSAQNNFHNLINKYQRWGICLHGQGWCREAHAGDAKPFVPRSCCSVPSRETLRLLQTLREVGTSPHPQRSALLLLPERPQSLKEKPLHFHCSLQLCFGLVCIYLCFYMFKYKILSAFRAKVCVMYFCIASRELLLPIWPINLIFKWKVRCLIALMFLLHLSYLFLPNFSNPLSFWMTYFDCWKAKRC